MYLLHEQVRKGFNLIAHSAGELLNVTTHSLTQKPISKNSRKGNLLVQIFHGTVHTCLLLCINEKKGNKRKEVGKKPKAKIKSFFMILSSKAGRQAFSPIASGRLRYLRACLPFRNNRLVLNNGRNLFLREHSTYWLRLK